jgi:hypothetical protein
MFVFLETCLLYFLLVINVENTVREEILYEYSTEKAKNKASNQKSIIRENERKA